MRKIFSLIAVLWVATIGFANNDPSKPSYRTYSVQADSYTTDYMIFQAYHATLDVSDLLRVSDKGDFRIVLNYLKGLKAESPKLLTAEQGTYYAVPVTTPAYKVKVYGKANKLFLEKQYGGDDLVVDFGKGQYQDNTAVISAWEQGKKAFLQKTEFQSLKFDQLEKDLIGLVRVLESTAAAAVTEEAPVYEDSPIIKDIFSATDGINDDDYASENLSEEGTETSPTKVIMNPRRNLVKLNLPNLSFKNITLGYERIVSDRTSLSLNIGYILPNSPATFITDALDFEPEGSNEFSGYTATGEYRIYSKKKGAPKGLYYAPYLRYASYKYLFDDTIDDNFANIDTKVSTFGLGLQLGYQWVIKNRFVIDWGILGVAAQQYTFSSTFSSMDDAINFEEIQKSLEEDVEDINILKNNLEFTQGDDFLKAKLPFLFGGLRSYLSVGLQF